MTLTLPLKFVKVDIFHRLNKPTLLLLKVISSIKAIKFILSLKLHFLCCINDNDALFKDRLVWQFGEIPSLAGFRNFPVKSPWKKVYRKRLSWKKSLKKHTLSHFDLTEIDYSAGFENELVWRILQRWKPSWYICQYTYNTL